MPLISVIVPVYNVENYLSECIESVLAQTFQDFELILVNDGSTDKSLEICEKYTNDKIRIINKKNGGLSSARNAGLEIAKGKYITFIDSDDWIEKTFLSVMLEQMNKDTDLVQCGYSRITDQKNVLYKSDTTAENLISKKDILDAYFISNNLFTMAWAKLIKIELFNDIRFKEGKNNEDVIMMSDLFCKLNKVVIVDQNLYNYRVNESSITRVSVNEKKISDFFFSLNYLKEKIAVTYPEYLRYINYLFCRSSIEFYYQLQNNKENSNFTKMKNNVLDVYNLNYNELGSLSNLNISIVEKVRISLFKYNKFLTVLILKFIKK